MKTNCSWFDSENARLIILCATLGIFGVHKFAQRKNFQGVMYILLDLTIFGIILTVILSWLDLIFLTAKSENRPGNMMFGAAFILLESFILIPSSSSVVIKHIDSPKDSVVMTVETVQEETEAEKSKQPVTEQDNVIKQADFSKIEIIPAPELNDKLEDIDRLVVEERQSSQIGTNEEMTQNALPIIEEKSVEPAKVDFPVAKKEPVQQKRTEYKPEAKTSLETDKHDNEDDDFEHFSLYNMVTGS